MIRDITLGQYYPAESVIHRLDARVKLLATIVYIVLLFCIKNYIGFGISAVFLLIVILISRVPIKFIFKGLRPIFLIIIFTFFLNLFMIPGDVILWKWKFLSISDEGFYRAMFMAIRLILLMIGSSILTFTTKPISLTDGIESVLNPLKRLGLPVHEIAMIMSIALRFIPTLLEETDKIMKAQQARGADFETGNILRRAKSMLPILVPLFINAFRIAFDLAMAMESRCYRGGVNRTKYHELKLHIRDYLSILILIMLTILLYFQSMI